MLWITLLVATLVCAPRQDSVETLIDRLRSEKPEEREMAARNLLDLGEKARGALQKASKEADPETQGRARDLLALLDRYAFLEELLTWYRSFGLPLPPPDAPLVKFGAGRWTVAKDGEYVPHYALGFLLKRGVGKEPSIALWGTNEHYVDDKKGEADPLKPEKKLVQGIQCESGNQTFPLNAGLLTAIQCKSRGWNDFAFDLLQESLKHDADHRFSAFYQPSGQPARTAFAFTVWAYFGNELLRAGTDRTVILRHLKSLVAAEPKLATKVSQSLLQALELAVQPSKAEPGSIEALIDGLVDASMGSRSRRDDDIDPRYSKLIELGFDAVPALIAHLDDQRLTRSTMQGFNNFPTYIRRVADLISDLLQGLAGDDMGKDWLRRQQGYTLDKEQAAVWWKSVQAEGEEKHLLKNALPKSDKKGEWPNDQILRVIAAKYPQRLAELYRSLLDERPDMQSHPLAKRVSRSALPKEQKVELFSIAGRHANLEHRRAAFFELKDIDRTVFTGLLIETLKELPETPKEAYWSCREASFAILVVHADDPRAWEVFEKTLRRVDAGLRLEMINVMSYIAREQRPLKPRVKLLSKLLDDTTVRDVSKNPELYSGPSAAGEYPRIEIRNWAAHILSILLELDDWSSPKWTDQEWAAYRERVRTAAAVRLGAPEK